MEETYQPGQHAKLYPKNTQRGYDTEITNKKNAKTVEKLLIRYRTSKPDRVLQFFRVNILKIT